jgi:hypothetical protein
MPESRKLPARKLEEDVHKYFTDMEQLRNRFHQLITMKNPGARIMVIQGPGGYGKSSLLWMFRRMCDDEKAPVGITGRGPARGAEERYILENLAEGLGRGKVRVELPGFMSILKKLIEVQQLEREERQKEERATGAIPGGFGGEGYRDWLRSFLTREQIALLQDPVKPLTDNFITDTAKSSGKRRVVLILDGYEQMQPVDVWVQSWIRQLVAPNALQANVLIVIAGRSFPRSAWDKDWPDWAKLTEVTIMKPMENKHVQQLVQNYFKHIKKRSDPAQVQKLVHLASGSPLVAVFAAHLFDMGLELDTESEETQETVRKLVEALPENMKRIVEGAAILRWVERPILEAVLGAVVSDAEYNELEFFPFTRSDGSRLVLHDVVRESVENKLSVLDPERRNLWHERAADYFERALAEEDPVPVQNRT